MFGFTFAAFVAHPDGRSGTFRQVKTRPLRDWTTEVFTTCAISVSRENEVRSALFQVIDFDVLPNDQENFPMEVSSYFFRNTETAGLFVISSPDTGSRHPISPDYDFPWFTITSPKYFSVPTSRAVFLWWPTVKCCFGFESQGMVVKVTLPVQHMFSAKLEGKLARTPGCVPLKCCVPLTVYRRLVPEKSKNQKRNQVQ